MIGQNQQQDHEVKRYCDLCGIELIDNVFYFSHSHTKATVNQVASRICRSAEKAIADRKKFGENDLSEIDMQKCLGKLAR